MYSMIFTLSFMTAYFTSMYINIITGYQVGIFTHFGTLVVILAGIFAELLAFRYWLYEKH